MKKGTFLEAVLLLWRRLPQLLLCAAVGMAIACMLTVCLVRPTYTASASMYVSIGREDGTMSADDIEVSKQLTQTYLVLLKSDLLLKEVQDRLGSTAITEAELRKKLFAGVLDSANAFTVSITDVDALRAQKTANLIAETLPEIGQRVIPTGKVTVIDWAQVPVEADWPLLHHAILGLLFGVFCGAAAIILLDALDTTVHSAESLEQVFTIPVLGRMSWITVDDVRTKG